MERILKLTPTIRKIGYKLALTSPEHTSDDLFQVAMVGLIEKAENDTTFLEQKDGYILGKARLIMLQFCRSAQDYIKYVDSPTPDPNPSNSNDVMDGIVTPSCDLETQYIEAEKFRELAQITLSLSPDKQKIVSLIYQGYKLKDIANDTGVSYSCVKNRKSRLFSELRDRIKEQETD